MMKQKKTITFDSPSRAFSYATCRYALAYKKMCELEEDMEYIQNQIVNVKSPSTQSIGEQKQRKSLTEKDLVMHDLNDQLEEINERHMQLSLFVGWVDKIIEKLPPELKYFAYVTYIKKETKYAEKDKHLRQKILESVKEVVSQYEIETLEGIINEDLDPEELKALKINL